MKMNQERDGRLKISFHGKKSKKEKKLVKPTHLRFYNNFTKYYFQSVSIKIKCVIFKTMKFNFFTFLTFFWGKTYNKIGKRLSDLDIGICLKSISTISL